MVENAYFFVFFLFRIGRIAERRKKREREREGKEREGANPGRAEKKTHPQLHFPRSFFTPTSSLCLSLSLLSSPPSPLQINMYINSPGGVVTAGLAIYDTMQYISSPVATLCVGQAASMGSLLLAAGEPGHRRALPHSRIMLHQPSGGYQGQATDIRIHTEEILRLRGIINQIYARHTGRKVEEIAETLERDTFLAAEQAKDFGILDEVIEKRAEAAEAEF